MEEQREERWEEQRRYDDTAAGTVRPEGLGKHAECEALCGQWQGYIADSQDPGISPKAQEAARIDAMKVRQQMEALGCKLPCPEPA